MKYICDLINFYKGEKEIKRILEIYKSYNLSNYYEDSSDYQILDISLEHNFNQTLEPLSRFSLFGLSLNFLNKLNFLNIDLGEFYNYYKSYTHILKDEFITLSFEYKNNNIIKLKIYFDVIESNNIVLKSISLGEKGILEIKDYYQNKNSNLKICEYTPYDVLYRKDQFNKLISKKLYFKEDTIANKRLISNLKHKYFNKIGDLFNHYNFKDEVGIDFSVFGKITKITYYRGIYKNGYK